MGDGLRRWVRVCAHGADADGDDPTRSDGQVLGESRWRHLRGRVRQGGQEDLHLLLHFCRERQEGERHRKLRQEVQWGSQEHVTEQRRLLVHLWIQRQEGQGQDGRGYRCWRLYWRYWRRLRNAADATNRHWIWIRLPWIWNWTIWIRIR